MGQTFNPYSYVQISALKQDVAFVLVFDGAHCVYVAGFSSMIDAKRAEPHVVEYVRETQSRGSLTSFITERC